MGFQQQSLEYLKDQYIQSLSTVNAYSTKKRKEYKATYSTKAKVEITILNQITADLRNSILLMEKYLPLSRQIYLQKELQGYTKRYSAENYSPPTLQKHSENPEAYVCDLMMQKKLFDTIYNILTPRQFEVIYLYYYQNIKLSKIAKTFEISKPTVTEHLHKALDRIKNCPVFINFIKNHLSST